MTYLLAFILGFALCAVLCWKRLRELKQALDAAHRQIEGQFARELRFREAFTRLRGGLREVGNILGGTATLPAAAGKQNGQQSDAFSILANSSGPPPARPHFSGRYQ